MLLEPQAGELPVITALAGFIITYQGGSGRNGAGLITGMGVEVLFIHQLVDKAEVNGILARIALLHAKTRGEALPVELHVHERALVGARGFQLRHLGRRLHEIHANVIHINVAAVAGGGVVIQLQHVGVILAGCGIGVDERKVKLVPVVRADTHAQISVLSIQPRGSTDLAARVAVNGRALRYVALVIGADAVYGEEQAGIS